MTDIKLKLNPDKTEFLLLGTASKRAELAICFPIDLLGSLVSPSDNAKNFGEFFTLISHSRITCLPFAERVSLKSELSPTFVGILTLIRLPC